MKSLMKFKTLFRSWPIFWQLMALSLSVLILTLLISTTLVLKAPAPMPSGYRLIDVVDALKTGQARLQNDRLLKAFDQDHPPPFFTKNEDENSHPLKSMIIEHLSKRLNVPKADLKLDFPHFDDTPPKREEQKLHDEMMSNGANKHVKIFRSHVQFVIRHTGSMSHDANMSMPGLDEQINFPPFAVAWRLDDGHYRIIMPPKALIEPWQWQLIVGFIIAAILILPLAYLMSKSLSAPIIALAKGASQLDFSPGAKPLDANGPSEVRAALGVLNELQQRISKQIEDKTALMAAIAHDLKTPLARMRLRIETLDDAQKEPLAQDIRHMDSLISSAMSFASAQTIINQLYVIDLSSLVESLCEDLEAIYHFKSIQIEHGVHVLGDVTALKRIVTNLIENAFRYGETCRVSLTANEQCVEISIADSGKGVPDEALEAVFEPFYRLETSRNRDTGGAGLGLSVVRKLSEALKGSVKLYNSQNGLNAVFTLPVVRKA